MPQQTFEDVVIAEIKAEMARQDMPQRELASRLGWHQTQISSRLRRKVKIRAEEIDQIADALGVDVVQLGWPFERRGKQHVA